MTDLSSLVVQDATNGWLFIPSAILLARCTGWSPATPRR
jgi:hypothetical protein